MTREADGRVKITMAGGVVWTLATAVAAAGISYGLKSSILEQNTNAIVALQAKDGLQDSALQSLEVKLTEVSTNVSWIRKTLERGELR